MKFNSQLTVDSFKQLNVVIYYLLLFTLIFRHLNVIAVLLCCCVM